MRKEWYDQLPMIAALCYSAQDEPDTTEAVREALELLTECEGVDMTLTLEKNLAAFIIRLTKLHKEERRK